MALADRTELVGGLDERAFVQGLELFPKSGELPSDRLRQLPRPAAYAAVGVDQRHRPRNTLARGRPPAVELASVPDLSGSEGGRVALADPARPIMTEPLR